MKELWLLLVVALVVWVSVIPAGGGLPRVGEVAFEGPAQVRQIPPPWNPFARAARALEMGLR